MAQEIALLLRANALFGSWLASGGRMKDVWLPLSTPRQASPQVPGSTDRNYTALKIHNKLLLKSYQPVNFEYRWVQHYAPELDKRCRPYLKTTNDSYRVDETYIKVKGEWKYLYRAVDSEGNTIDFLLRAKRDVRAAERFFRKAL